MWMASYVAATASSLFPSGRAQSPRSKGVRCQDARRFLEGLSLICTWMPFDREVLQAQVISRSPAESLVSTYGFLWRPIRAGNRPTIVRGPEATSRG